MSNEVFPALPGLMWDIEREEQWKNMSRESDSGRDFTRAIWTSPQRHYRLQYEFLRSGAEAELQALVGFFNRHKGDFDTWLFDDPMDNVVVNEPLGVTNGTQSTWQLTRAFGGASSPVFELKAPPELYLNMGDWRGNERKYFTPRTNIFTQSDISSWADYTEDSSVVANATAAPDGTVTADFMKEGSGSAAHLMNRYQVLPSTGTLYLSVFAKASTRSNLILGLQVDAAIMKRRRFNLAAGTTADLDSGDQGGIIAYPDGWYRCWMRSVLATTAANIQRVQLENDSTGGTSYTGDGTSGLYLWGAQMEKDALTPYIPTAGAAVTVTDATINSTGLVTLSPTPAAGGSLSWSGGYYWRCKFKQSRMAYKQFMQHLFSARSVDFKTYKP